MSSPRTSAVDALFDEALRALQHLVRVAGVSHASYPVAEVRRSAEEVAGVLDDWRFDDVRILETSGHPAVYGQIVVSEAAPTILIYGHHDVQPPGRPEVWLSPPFEPTIRDGRMFGRGTADDKGGFLAYLSAARGCRNEASLRCNVKVLIEGEEEIGSPNLPDLLDRNRSLFDTDYALLCDTPNFDTGIPALTYRLRGNCIVDVEVRCLERAVHSGQGGGVLPDAAMILCRILASLQHEDGSLNLPEIEDEVVTDESELATIRDLPFDREQYQNRTGVLDGVQLTTQRNVREQIWTRPSLTITAIESVPLARAANQISDAARARLSLRTVPGIDTKKAGERLTDAIHRRGSFGARVSTRVLGGPAWWRSDPHHPVYAAARRALTRGFGAEAVMAGSGGSIGFVQPFAELLGTAPPLLTGVQDPLSNAHAENESLHLGDFRKAMHAAAYLFDEIAELGHRAGRGC